MNIIHIAHQMSSINGIAEVLIILTKEQIALGHNVKILCTKVNDIYGADENVMKLDSQKHFESIVQNFRPDLVVFHSLYRFNYLFYANLLKKKRIPYAVEFHGAATEHNRKKGYLKKTICDILFFNKFLKNASGAIYLNDDEKNSSVYRNIIKRELVIPNGLYINNRCSSNIDNSISNKIEFLYLARIDYNHKGLDILVNALKKITKMPISEKINFSFYGKGKDLYNFKKDIADVSFAKYKGLVYGNDKDRVFLESDILVLTSRYEGMPMSILEALSFGCPCLITEMTNMASIIKDKAGWITPLTEDGIIETIHKAVEEYSNNKKMYRASSVEIAKQFDWKKVAISSIENYEELL